MSKCLAQIPLLAPRIYVKELIKSLSKTKSISFGVRQPTSSCYFNIHLEGEHLGWKYELLRTVPVSAILWRLGVTMSGLCHETSFQPRSSASITTRSKVFYSN